MPMELPFRFASCKACVELSKGLPHKRLCEKCIRMHWCSWCRFQETRTAGTLSHDRYMTVSAYNSQALCSVCARSQCHGCGISLDRDVDGYTYCHSCEPKVCATERSESPHRICPGVCPSCHATCEKPPCACPFDCTLCHRPFTFHAAALQALADTAHRYYISELSGDFTIRGYPPTTESKKICIDCWTRLITDASLRYKTIEDSDSDSE